MFTGTEFMSQCTASNLAEPIPRTASKPELGEILVFTDNRSEAANILEFAQSTCRREWRASDQRIHAAGARNYPGRDVRPRQGHAQRD